MESCLEKCNNFARSKPARIFYGILLVLVCCVGIIRLLNASNHMQRQREKQSHLELFLKPEGESLIYYRGTDEDSNAWTSKLDEFLAPYRYPHPNRQKCDYNNPPAPGKVCGVDLEELGVCSPSSNYGNSKSSACVFLKLRKDSSWTPEFYNSSELPSDMPNPLKDYIDRNVAVKNKQIVWVSCEGATPVDIENVGTISYIPERGFHKSAIENEELEPFIGIYLANPQRGIVISVKCRIWARNADDSITFEVLLD